MPVTEGHGPAPLEIPARPSERELGEGANAQSARARTREEETAPAASLDRHVASAGLWVQAVLNGGSLWHSDPPSLAKTWDRHAASARYFNSGLFRGLRWCWACVHIAVGAPLLLMYWLLHSFPLVLAAAGIVLAAHWLL